MNTPRTFMDKIMYNVWLVITDSKEKDRFDDLENMVPTLTPEQEEKLGDYRAVVRKRLSLTDAPFLLSRFLQIIGQSKDIPFHTWKDFTEMIHRTSLLGAYLNMTPSVCEDTKVNILQASRSIRVNKTAGYVFWTKSVSTEYVRTSVTKKMPGFIRIHNLLEGTQEDVKYSQLDLKIRCSDNSPVYIDLSFDSCDPEFNPVKYTFRLFTDLDGRIYFVGIHLPNEPCENGCLFLLDLRIVTYNTIVNIATQSQQQAKKFPITPEEIEKRWAELDKKLSE